MRLSTAFRVIVALGLACWAFVSANPSQVLDAFARTSWSWVLVACLLVLLDRALMAHRWLSLCTLIARRPPRAELLRIFFVSTFLGTFLVQSIGSDAVRTWSLARAGAPTAQALASVLLDRLLGVASILVSAVAGVALAPYVLREPAIAWAFAAASAGCLIALLFVFSVRVDEVVRRAVARLPAGRLQNHIGKLLDALQAYRAAHHILAGVLVASVAVQVLRILQAWFLGRSLGIEAPLTSYFAFIPIILLVMLLPITFNGLGVSQWAFVWTFTRVGVPEANAFALSILFVALGLVGNLPGGILYAVGPPALREGPPREEGKGQRAEGKGEVEGDREKK
ncbi:MAG TPA: lysylphosphatidylglycerol synthase transmembrane domain-containing protein [Vicinamibacterales bacterium]|nr:lysylphosphatidylglycerol synthase transmembrane domain-containing protein [Vicinamibacterales bacterium]